MSQARGEGLRLTAAPQQYAAVSLSNVVATTCQYEALKYVSFPVQTLGKCAKMIPVMVWGALIMQKRYQPREFLLAGAHLTSPGLALSTKLCASLGRAGAVTAGTTVFLLAGPVTAKRSGAQAQDSLWGVALMGGYLGCDGFTSTFQVRCGVASRVAAGRVSSNSAAGPLVQGQQGHDHLQPDVVHQHVLGCAQPERCAQDVLAEPILAKADAAVKRRVALARAAVDGTRVLETAS